MGTGAGAGALVGLGAAGGGAGAKVGWGLVMGTLVSGLEGLEYVGAVGSGEREEDGQEV